MRRLLRPTGLAIGLFAVLTSCASDRSAAPGVPSLVGGPSGSLASLELPSVRISEIHYDNASTDAGERIEISGPKDTDLAGWQILLYNGAGGAVYNTANLSGKIPDLCDAPSGRRGVVVVSYVVNGIQNGNPDGIALVSPSGLVEFLSYGGPMTGVGGAANGVVSTDIGVAEGTSTPIGHSLQRSGTGTWASPQANSFGACNDNDEPLPPKPVASVTVSPTEAELVRGATLKLLASALDVDGAPTSTTFTWTSSDNGVATVNTAGLVTARAVGTAVITVASANGKTAEASVAVLPLPDIRLTEIHYDNDGTDVNEGIEVEGPAGADLSGWKVVLYNGSDGAEYDSKDLTGAFVNRCDGRGVLTLAIAGLQNGSPDGIALVDADNQVVEFLSYEGSFAATNGPAAGKTSRDIGVLEPGNGPAVHSLQLLASTALWQSPSAATFGRCNEGDVPPPPPPSIVITELMADPFQVAATFGEWFEVYNAGTTPIDLVGFTIGSTGQPNRTISSSVVIAPGAFAVLGRDDNISRNGGAVVDFNYFTGSSASTIFLDDTDELSLRDGFGQLVDVVRWTNGSTMARGVSRALRDVSADNANVDGINWAYSTATYGSGDFGTPRAPNGDLSDTPPPLPNRISFTGRLTSDPALPVGFEDQLFATMLPPSGPSIPTTFTWSSDTPGLASVDAHGVMHALAEGTAIIRATAADGTVGRFFQATIVATPSPTAQYGHNSEFGEPTDANASDDFLVRRDQYTSSFNRNRGIPNWVSYNLDASHFATGTAVDRCDCFTFDPLLPLDFTRYTTADYTGAGAAAGYGIDRGHLARSFDRTAGTLDNATTYYFSNIIPQAADNNQGPWAIFENYLGDLARAQNKEVYIVAGASGSKGTVKNEGLITIPAKVWKVALIMPRDQGLANVHGTADIEVIAVILPNDPGIRNVSWETYKTTVNAVEVLSGYDVFALLSDEVEQLTESGLQGAFSLVDQFVASGELSRGNGISFRAKLDAALKQLERGNTIPGANQLEALLHEIDAIVRTGRLSAPSADALRAQVLFVIRSATD
jgi:DNA/RNA endonuclease G (NUC1)